MDPKNYGFELLHLGINRANEEEGTATAMLMAELFGFPLRETPGAWFVNEQFEVMKKPFRGTLGHIAIGTTNIEEACKWLESKGYEFDYPTAIYDENGKLKLVYSNNELAGFAFHLTQKI